MSQQSEAARKPGGQPGNQNAAKDVTTQKVQVLLYPDDLKLANACAAKLNTNRSAAIRQAIAELAAKLGVTAV